MKYAITALLIAALALVAFPAAYADSDSETLTATTVDAETQVEIESMDGTHGALVRLLQLERELQRKVIEANALIAVLDNRTNSTNITDLKDIVAELEIMIDQVQAAQASVGTDNQIDVETFVTIKKDARGLIKQFREAAKDIVTKEDREAIKRARENADKSELTDISERIETERKEHRANRLADSLERTGVADAELIEKVRAGTISIEDARKEIRAKINALEPEQRRNAVSSIEEETARRRVQMLAHIDKVEDKLGDVKVRMEERIKKMEDKGNTKVADRIRIRSENRVEKTEDRLDDRRGKIEDRMDRAEDRVERRDNRTNQTNRTDTRGLRPEMRIRGSYDSGEDSESDLNEESRSSP